MTYKEDRIWSDIFIPEIINIITEEFVFLDFEVSKIEDDIYKATDLISTDGLNTIGVRCRSEEYINYFDIDFTIRYKRYSGKETELQKIYKHGYCSYYFYCITNENKLLKWRLLDMNIFRKTISSSKIYFNSYVRKFKKENKDNSSDFIPFKYKDFPDNFIISKSD